jgi:hypothetical protein
MSGAPSLPRDVRQWPADPYQLLGVSPGAAPNEVRSAYDRLAAAFDPRREPEPCRRLREARDAVLRDLDLRRILDAPLTLELGPDIEPAPRPPSPMADDPSLAEALWAPLSPEVSAPAPPPNAVAPAPIPPPRRNVIGLWETALAGREAEAYRGLVGALDEKGATEDLCLRLYWLLTAMPELDRERSPRDWLVRGLQARGLSGPLWELYGRALAVDDGEALSDRPARLFQVPAEPGRLAELARLRWRAVARRERWDIISADLEMLRRWLPPSERVAWALVWSAGLDQLMWSDAPAARDLTSHCVQSLRTLQSVSSQVEELQRRANHLRDLSAAWRRLRSEPEVPPPLLVLVALSWSRPFAEARPKLLAFLAEALRLPRGLLRALDVTSEQPAVLEEFGHLLGQLGETLPPEPIEARSSSDLAELVFGFLDTADRSHYRTLRPPLLEFCLREAIAPETVAESVAENRYYQHSDTHLSEAIAADEPLRLTYLAHRLFWT